MERGAPMSNSEARKAQRDAVSVAPAPVPAAVTAAAWREAAGIVETYETVADAVAGLRAMANLLERAAPIGVDQ